MQINDGHYDDVLHHPDGVLYWGEWTCAPRDRRHVAQDPAT